MINIAITAEVEVLHKSKNRAIMCLKPRTRVLVTKDNTVSSLPRSDTKSIYKQLKNISMCVISVENGSKQKVAKVDDVKRVKKNGEWGLKLKLSSDKYNGEGSFAKSAVNLQDYVWDFGTFWFSDPNRSPYSGVVIRDRDFSGQDLTNADFSFSIIANSQFIGADLTNANFRHSDLRGSNFTRANLTNADFRFSDTRDTIFTDAITVRTRF